MKMMFVLAALAVTLPAHAKTRKPSSADSDACSKAALKAAEDEYGNDPKKTKVKVVMEGKEYRVAVGIGNDEDGEHDYYVSFPNGCQGKPTVSEIDN